MVGWLLSFRRRNLLHESEKYQHKHIQDCINRYSSMRYPLETYVLNKKTLPISSLLNPVARRISHVDPLDLLDKNESIESDPYLEGTQMVKEFTKIPLIFSRSG